jgi:hypothetical protein
MNRRKIKVFTSSENIDYEEEINNFLERLNANPVSVSVHQQHDLFYDGSIGNQWQDVILIYELEDGSWD